MKKPSRWNRKRAYLIKGGSINWHPLADCVQICWFRHIGKSEWPSNYWIKHFENDYLGLQIVTEGKMTLTRGNTTITAQAGDALISTPGDGYRIATSSEHGCKKVYLALSGTILSLMEAVHSRKIMLISDFYTSEFSNLFEQAYLMAVEQKTEHAPKLSRILYGVLIYTIGRMHVSQLPQELIKCRRYIELNISEKITLADLCCCSGCCKTVLTQLFKEYLQKSPGEYLKNVRLQYACCLLQDYTLSIGEVADQCGYCNQLYFSNDFKKHYGSSPRQWRNDQF
jgi:AraC-like DNA-binding protein